MAVTPDQVVAEAMSWLGTPFLWQASLKGVGADCKGLVRGVAREKGLPEAEGVWARRCDYGRRVPLADLQRGLAETFERIAAYEPGDVVQMMMGGHPQHLGIVGDGVVIHTYARGPRQVIATPLSVLAGHWPVAAAWRFKSVVR